MTNYSEGVNESSKEVSNFGVEHLANYSDGTEESNKEPSNDSSKYDARRADLSDRVVEGLDEEHDAEGETGTFYDAAPDVEDSSAEDDAFYE